MIKSVTFRAYDCTHPGSNYYRHMPYLLPRLSLHPISRQTEWVLVLGLGFKSYQLSVRLNGRLRTKLKAHWERGAEHRRIYADHYTTAE